MIRVTGPVICSILKVRLSERSSGRVAASVIWAAVVDLLFFYGPEWVHQSLLIPLTAHLLIGTVLGLLLVFRTNSSYDRFWEGRKMWGGIVNECRNLARQSSIWLAADPGFSSRSRRLDHRVPYATMQRLRNASGWGTVLRGLSEAELRQVERSDNVPLAVARAMTARLLIGRQRGLIDGLQLTALDQNIQLLVDYLGACERIRSTPMPFAYTVHLRRLLIVYCLTLPLALVHEFGWTTIPTVLLISYGLFGIEEIGVEIEDPFGVTANDLPLQTFCAGIESTLREIQDSPINDQQPA